MTTTSLKEFLPLIALHAPGVPDLVSLLNLRAAAVEFCERTRCWRHAATITFDEDNPAPMVAPDYAAIHEIEWAAFQNETIARRELKATQYTAIAPGGLDAFEGTTPEYISQASPNTVIIFPFAAGSLNVSLFLKPRFGQDFTNAANTQAMEDYFNQVPSFMLTQFGEVIANGALARLLFMPQQRWTNPQNGMLFNAKFERAVDAAFSTNIRGQHRAPARTKSIFY